MCLTAVCDQHIATAYCVKVVSLTPAVTFELVVSACCHRGCCFLFLRGSPFFSFLLLSSPFFSFCLPEKKGDKWRQMEHHGDAEFALFRRTHALYTLLTRITHFHGRHPLESTQLLCKLMQQHATHVIDCHNRIQMETHGDTRRHTETNGDTRRRTEQNGAKRRNPYRPARVMGRQPCPGNGSYHHQPPTLTNPPCRGPCKRSHHHQPPALTTAQLKHPYLARPMQGQSPPPATRI